MAGELVIRLLDEAQQWGFLGPGPVPAQAQRSLAFATLLGSPPTGLAVDLGTGGGLPGLVLADHWPGSEWVFIEANQRRAAWLTKALDQLQLAHRVRVVCERAEATGRGPLRGTASLVTARSFAAPSATAECAAPLLNDGGVLVVAEPPSDADVAGHTRWPADGLAALNLTYFGSDAVSTPAGPVTLGRLVLYGSCPERFPRKVGTPEKRPLF